MRPLKRVGSVDIDEAFENRVGFVDIDEASGGVGGGCGGGGGGSVCVWEGGGAVMWSADIGGVSGRKW